VARTAYPALSIAQLNRATLARQLLLERSRLDPVAAAEQIGGLQAQEPASPYLGLWTRLRSFDAADLDAAFRARRMVKASLMRATLHAVSLDDYLHLLPAIQPMLRGRSRRETAGSPKRERIERLAEAAIAFSAQPRTNVELREYMATLADGDIDLPWWWVRLHAPFIHVPAETAWSFGRRPALIAAQSWAADRRFATREAGTEHLVRRYLGAFGPAAITDMSTWSGLGMAGLRAAVAAVDADGDLMRFSDESGRELIDLAAAPRPDGDVPAPPRLLPMWDSLVLGHRDRTRFLTDDHRAIVIARNGDTLPTFLVDGRVAGLWWAEPDGATATRIVLEPFGMLARAARLALEEEAQRLAEFVGPREPAVYRRYRTTRARRSAG